MPPDFIEKIELLVNDENRIVTYKCLSHELKIHVNKAKQYLMDFLNAQKLKGIDLEVHYFLAGFIKKDGLQAVKVLVVSEDKLEKAKESFTELTSFHIYSIYKGISKDECALYSADFAYTKDKGEQNKYSAIKHPNIEIQPPVLNRMQTTTDVKLNFSKKEESQAATNGHLSSGNSKLEANVKPSDCSLPEKNDVLKNNELVKSKENKTSPDSKKQKPGTLMSMWQKKDQSNDKKKESSEQEVKGKGAAKNVPKNNILSMFSKQAVKNAEKPPVPKPTVSKVESPKMEVNEVNNDNTSKNVSSHESKKSLKRKMTNQHSKASKSKHDSDSENDFKSKSKKHRRICTFDSSSESEAEEEKERAQRSFFLPEEPLDTVAAIPMSDEELLPPTPPVVHVKGKAKVWKTVQKTYEDEDGFLVTRNEKELVSASEDEEDPLKTKMVKKDEVVNKKTPNVNKKQASLMSFFRQK